MSLFSACVYKIIPLYISILIGFIAGKQLEISRDSIARLMLYVLNPIVVFNGMCLVKLEAGVLFLPVLVAVISSILCLVFYRLAGYFWNDETKSLVGFTAGNGNTGYFGLPIALLLFDDQGEAIYILAILGVTLFENTLGFYIFMHHSISKKECLIKLLKLPTLYAFLLGILFNVLQVPSSDMIQEYMSNIKGAYTIFGMMSIGLGLAGLKHFKLDFIFIGLSFLARFVAWPILMLSIIYLDSHFFHFYNYVVYNALLLVSIVPLGTNSVLMASLRKVHPEKAATAVVLSIIFALFFVPFMIENFICSAP